MLAIITVVLLQTKGRTRIEIAAKTASNLKVAKGIIYCYTCLTKLCEEQPCVWVCDLFLLYKTNKNIPQREVYVR